MHCSVAELHFWHCCCCSIPGWCWSASKCKQAQGRRDTSVLLMHLHSRDITTTQNCPNKPQWCWSWDDGSALLQCYLMWLSAKLLILYYNMTYAYCEMWFSGTWMSTWSNSFPRKTLLTTTLMHLLLSMKSFSCKEGFNALYSNNNNNNNNVNGTFSQICLEVCNVDYWRS